MIIKKNRLNKIMGLGDVPAEEVSTNLPEEVSPSFEENNVLQSDAVKNISTNNNIISEQEAPVSKESLKIQQPVNPDEINLFDLDNIDFSQRQERRRGDRRRGFRRVDDRNLVSRAREEADSIREAAMKEGYQAGLEQSKEDLDELKNNLSQFLNAKQEVFEYIAPDILEISVDIAGKIIKKEIEQDPQVLFNTIVDVLKTLSKDENRITIRVNPAEANEVKQAVPELLNLAGLEAKIVVLQDEEVSEGGCLVSTTNGVVDATIESRIAIVTQALKEL